MSAIHAPAAIPRPALAARLVLLLIRAYQAVSHAWGGHCRFTPSCSEYARQAVAWHGAARGLRLAIRRLSRCHPFGGSGYDPVPRPKSVTRRPRPKSVTRRP